MNDARNELHKETAAARVLRAHLVDALADGDDDEDLIRDSVEGQTDLHEAIGSAAALIFETEGHLAAIKALSDRLTARKQRYEHRIRMVKAAVSVALEMGELKSLELPFGTISQRSKPRALIVQDETAIPSDYWKATPKLDRKMLTAALKNGAAIPGADLDNGGVTVAFRWS